MMIKNPHLCTKLEVWTPRYSDKWSNGEYVALLHKSKVHHASSTIIIEFTKAKHLQGQRFAITRDIVQACPLTSNKRSGELNMYAVPMSKFDSWESYKEVHDKAIHIFDNVYKDKRTESEQINLL